MGKMLRLLFDYSKYGKLIDVYFVQNLINFLICEHSLDKYINRISIFENELNDYASYNFLTKDLTLYKLDALFEKYREPVEKLNLNTFEHNLFLNLSVILFILHELNHAIQNKEIIQGKTNNRSNLLNVNYQLIMGNLNVPDLKNYYVRMYEFLPMERMAELDAFKFIIDFWDFSVAPTIKKIIERSYLKVQLMGYDNFYSPPSKVFLESLGLNRLWEHYKSNNYGDLNDRLYMGLEISEEEYNLQKDKIRSIVI